MPLPPSACHVEAQIAPAARDEEREASAEDDAYEHLSNKTYPIDVRTSPPAAPPAAPSSVRPPPPPYSPFYTEQSGGSDSTAGVGTRNPEVKAEASPRRCAHPSVSASPRRQHGININVNASSSAEPRTSTPSGRCPEPVLVSPLLLSSQLHTIPLTVDNVRFHDASSSPPAEVDDEEIRNSLAVFSSLDYVQLTRDGGSGDFTLRDAKGDRILTAADEVGCTAALLGKNRPFDITVCDPAFTELFTLKRPFSCNSLAIPFSLPRLCVSTPSAGVIGQVKMRWRAFDQHLTIHDPRSPSSPVCHVRRRCLPLMTRGDNEFKILDPSGKVQIGKIHSRRTSMSSSMKLPEDRLAVSFPKSLDSRIKATLVGSLFLLRELYFRP